jgi:hypothetical protein
MPNWPEIRSELSRIPELIPGNTGVTFQFTAWRMYKRHLPLLWEWFDSVDVHPFHVARTYIAPGDYLSTHSDLGPYDLSLNVPLAGCEGVYTRLYQVPEDSGKVLEADGGPKAKANSAMTPYHSSVRWNVEDMRKPTPEARQRYQSKAWPDVPTEKLKEIACFDLSTPVLLNIKVPHGAVNNTDRVRESLSFRFKTDPWHLAR